MRVGRLSIYNPNTGNCRIKHAYYAMNSSKVVLQAIFIFAVLILWVFLGGTLLTRIESWKEVTKQRDDAQLFQKAIKNLGIIMGVTCVCLFIQFVMLMIDFIGGSVHARLSNVSYNIYVPATVVPKLIWNVQSSGHFYEVWDAVEFTDRFYSPGHSVYAIYGIHATETIHKK